MHKKVPSMDAAFLGVAEQKVKVAHFLTILAIVLFVVSFFLPNLYGAVTAVLALFSAISSGKLHSNAKKLKAVVERREKDRQTW